MKRICILTNHFLPEDFKVNDVAFHLQRNGYMVTVITAVPDYPKGKFFDGYGIFRKNHEILEGIEVIRLPIISRGNGSNQRLVANYASYFMSSLIFVLIYSFFKKFDLVLVHMTSPIFIGIPAVLMKKVQNIPLVFWVLDLWPESVVAVNAIKNNKLMNLLSRIVYFIYKNSDRILVSSECFFGSLMDKGVSSDKIEYFPNWSEEIVGNSSVPQTMVQLLESEQNNNTMYIMFAGNLGEAQNIEFILDTISCYKSKFCDTKFVFLGDGRNRKKLIRIAREKGIEDICVFPGRFPLESMPSILSRADVLLLSLKDRPTFRMTVPAKLQFYMSQGKPILGIIKGEGEEIIKKSECGIIADPNDPHSLLQAIEIFKDMPRKCRIEMGQKGKRFYFANFSKEKCMQHLRNVIESEIKTNYWLSVQGH